MRYNRVRLRRVVFAELHNVRAYRQELREKSAPPWDVERMQAWVRVADDLLAFTRDESSGKCKAQFIDEFFGLTRRSPGSSRYVCMRAVDRCHASYDGVLRWRDDAVFTAALLAVQYGAVDLSSEG